MIEKLPMPKPAVFLDRDGVINVDVGYPYRKQDLKFITGAPNAISHLKTSGYLVVVVTNQSGVARGFFSENDVECFHRYIQQDLQKYHTKIDAFYSCPYHPDAIIKQYRFDHPDRKPKPGMIERAIKDLNIDRSKSFLIGDRLSDIQAAHAAGIPGYIFDGKNLDIFCKNILDIQDPGDPDAEQFV